MQVTVQDMMLAREARARAQQVLLSGHPDDVLVCLTLNIPGPVKDGREIRAFFEWAKEMVGSVLADMPILQYAENCAFTGCEGIWCVCGDAVKIKQRMTALEDLSPAARLMDLDIITGREGKLSREALGMKPRGCLICGGQASVCARARTHPLNELTDKTNQLIRHQLQDNFASHVADMAQQALMDEVAVTPKPGLVDKADSGAHQDMDLSAFLRSASVLHDYFAACVRLGLTITDPEECFCALRVPGMIAEEKMLHETGGVNTHKGAIFSMGVYCAALGQGFDGVKTDAVRALSHCQTMTQSILDQEMRKMNVSGIRQEVAAGFQTVRTVSLPCYDQCLASGLPHNDACLMTLLHLMCCAQDSNLLRRGGEEGIRFVRDASRHVLDAVLEHPGDSAFLKGEMSRLNDEMIRRNLSPGGCADLLAMTILVRLVDERKKV